MMTNAKDKDASKSRLVSSYVLSASGLNIKEDNEGHKSVVLARLIELYTLSLDQAQEAYDEMEKRLQESRLVIYFKPGQLFGDALPVSYNNIYNYHSGSSVDVRNNGENKFFGYNEPGTIIHDENIEQSIMKRGDYNNGNSSTFSPNVRPKYGTLQIFGHRPHSHESLLYGPSYLILKDYIKHNCTFTYGDSLALAGTEQDEARTQLSNYTNMGAVLRFMDEVTFRTLYLNTINNNASGSEAANFRYIEAQIHNEILFARDVDMIRIGHSSLNTSSEELNIRIKAFAERNMIGLEYF